MPKSRTKDLDFLDIFSLGLILLLFIFSILKYSYLPQFLDSYYHLSVANAFIESKGWVGYSWWDNAPIGRPHLYPPLYHLILVLMKTLGLEGIKALKLSNIAILPLFFFSLWFVMRKIVNSRFAFFILLALSSSFSFYVSVTGNIPASLGLILGLFSWLFLKENKPLSSLLFLSLVFYTHAAISWVFLISFIFLAIFNKEYRKPALKIILACLLLSSAIIYHQLRHARFFEFKLLYEARLIHFNIFLVLLCLVSLVFSYKKSDMATLLFCGFLIACVIVFFKYPYRIFNAQGMVGISLLAVLFIEKTLFSKSLKRTRYLAIIIGSYLFILSSSLALDCKSFKLEVFDSTYQSFISKKFIASKHFRSIYFPRYWLPAAKAITENSQKTQIIASNENYIAQLFSSLTSRPVATAMLGEIK
ncbi:MAG: hypothetical protein JW867_02895, partial [Candidatus Omnitrophica bacterium]|nr:hypothetical protein [Candidatus Omnitrophota bacterium]